MRIRTLLLLAAGLALVVSLVLLVKGASPAKRRAADHDVVDAGPRATAHRHSRPQPQRPARTAAAPVAEGEADPASAADPDREARMAAIVEARRRAAEAAMASRTGRRPRPLTERFPDALQGQGAPEPAAPPGTPDEQAKASAAGQYYDHGDYENAQKFALEVLKTQPGNIRMLRIVVSTACVMGDAGVAKQWAAKLPEAHRASMQTRCSKFGITL